MSGDPIPAPPSRRRIRRPNPAGLTRADHLAGLVSAIAFPAIAHAFLAAETGAEGGA
jgi:hypothetical protein